MPKIPFLSLLTDFHPSDGFIGAMKGIILEISPQTRVIDLAHELRKFSVREAAFILKTTYSYFPKETVFCVVIDPGVGTERRAIAVKTEEYYFVGPDNGVLFPAIQQERIKEIRELTNSKYFLSEISPTFHGRDIFAPVAAYLSKDGNIFGQLGPLIEKNSLVTFSLETFNITQKIATGEVAGIDSFGNVITNIPAEKFWGKRGKQYTIDAGEERITARFVTTFREGEEGEMLLLEENHGFLEFAINKASASRKLGIKVGEEIKIHRV
ncbi:MAG: SAM-dependent chlorinase/fluorinase [Candidatus Korarchaeota archaeon]|nr:SAM-dependent chlorinase/fluorinase [Candidatus Korarchaeota archaeon]NIU83899.1 hypothetical protein [Candidatus Thorarchaeota archaeon]NIW14042.1 hypothetical protein [Candidatus Thorarchaeota archaeon]NIW51731.1 hypothetical protein [Candidatus Korarchaeota archaeon]